MAIRYFSMFSGIGGFEYGIQQAITNKIEPKEQSEKHSISELGFSTDSSDSDGNRGWSSATCIGYSEIDKYAIKVYERNFNGHTNYGDATKINPKELPDFDLLVGGFPCQAFSIAGKRKGFDDTRGTLFFDIARILSEKRPRHLVLENVKGLLSHDSGKTFQTILGVLADLGYAVEWQVLNSKDFGVPQNRERVFIVGHLGGFSGRKVFPITNTYQQNSKSVQRYISNTLTARYEAAQATGTYIGEGQFDAQKIRRLTPKECERLQGFPDDWTKYGVGDEPISDTQRYKMCGNAVTTNVITAVIGGLYG